MGGRSALPLPAIDEKVATGTTGMVGWYPLLASSSLALLMADVADA